MRLLMCLSSCGTPRLEIVICDSRCGSHHLELFIWESASHRPQVGVLFWELASGSPHLRVLICGTSRTWRCGIGAHAFHHTNRYAMCREELCPGQHCCRPPAGVGLSCVTGEVEAPCWRPLVISLNGAGRALARPRGARHTTTVQCPHLHILRAEKRARSSAPERGPRAQSAIQSIKWRSGRSRFGDRFLTPK